MSKRRLFGFGIFFSILIFGVTTYNIDAQQLRNIKDFDALLVKEFIRVSGNGSTGSVIDGPVTFGGAVTFQSTISPAIAPIEAAGIEFEGTTSDDFETTLSVTDPTADQTIVLPDASGTAMLSTLATNAPDVANSVTGASAALVFEGTADAFETSLTATDPTGDRTITLPDASGTVMVTGQAVIIQNGAAPAATCTVGEIFLDTDEGDDTNCTTTADNSLCVCTATNTWTAFENN